MKKIRITSVFLILISLICALPAFSQTGTGTITGLAKDNSGAIIPGVDVTVTSPAMLGNGRHDVSDETGTYRFTQLEPGAYRVSFALPGFKTINIDGVEVTAGATMTINGPMEVSSVAEEVTVTSQVPAIDLQAATVGINWEQKKLDDLPWGRSMVGLAQMIPSIFVTTYDVGGNQMGGSSNIGGQIFGRSGGEVRTYDGVAWCMNFDDFGTYEEVQLSAAAKSAEAMSAGMLGTFVVKSGGNTVHGGAHVYWEDGSFQSNNVDAALLAKGFAVGNNNFTRYNQLAFDLGGPILHNKLWFFAAYDNDYSGQNVAGFVDQTTNQQAVYPIILDISTAKLSYQLNSKMKLEIMGQQNTKSAPYRNGGPFVPLQATQDQLTIGALSVLKWTYIMSPKMTADLGINRAGYWWPTVAHTSDPRIEDLTTTQTRGAYLANYTAPVRFQWNGSWSYFTDILGKSNEIKTGFMGWWDSSHVTNTGYPYQEFFEYKSQAADYAGCTGINCNYFSRPQQVITYDYPNYTKSIVDYESWYVNDKINLSHKLTLNAGVHYDHYSDYLPAQGNPNIGPFSAGDPFYQKIGGFPIFSKFDPRISLAYDVFGNGRVALKGSFSQYSGGSSSPGSLNGTGGNSINQATVISRTYSGTQANGLPCWDGTIPYVPIASCLSSTTGGGGTQTISPSLTTPYTSQYTGGVQVGWKKDYLVGFTAVRTFDYGGADKLNLSTPYSAYTQEVCAADPGRNNVGYPTDLAGGAAAGTAPISGTNPTPGQVCVYNVPKTNPLLNVTNNEYVNYAKGEGTKEYTAFESTFQKQQSHGWSFLFGYTLTYARVNNPNENLFSPNAVLYDFEVPTWNQAYKMNGTYDIPWHGLKYSSGYQIQSGTIYGRSVNITNAAGATSAVTVEGDAGRYPFVRIWDQRIAKVFKIGDRNTITGTFDLYNTMNANTVLSQVTTNGTTYGEPLSNGSGSLATAPILPARIFKLGALWKF
jgi:hypothetical protein